MGQCAFRKDVSAACASRLEVPNPTGGDRKQCQKDDWDSDEGRPADVTVRLISFSFVVQ